MSASELSRRMGVSKGAICDLMKGRSEAGLDMLLRLSTALAVPLPDLLLGLPPQAVGKARGVHHLPIEWPARTKPRKDWVHIQLALDFESASSMPPSVAAFAKRSQVDLKHIRSKLPSQTKALRCRHESLRQRLRQAEIEEVERSLAALGGASVNTQRGVSRRLRIGRSRRCFQIAWRR